jgi:cobyrinic acid a,c-diamide synthase
MPDERGDCGHALELMADEIARGVDVEAIHCLADGAARLQSRPAPSRRRSALGGPVTVGVLRDSAFSFYYPENLSSLEAQGARLVPISPLRDTELPAIDALYAGGGYPEEHAAELTANRRFRAALAARIAAGLPVWAECGGLMYLASAIVNRGERYPMVGALPIEIVQTERPQGHGYVEARVDTENPFLDVGAQLRGHEFHYSRPLGDGAPIRTALALSTGVGIRHRRDGIVAGRVFASYLHLFAPGTPEWAPGFVRVAREARDQGHRQNPS